MRVSIQKSDLLEAVNTVLKAVPSRTTMPILECILIQAAGGKIIFTGNDTEVGIQTICKGEIIEEGSVAIEAKIFSSIVRKLPDNAVTLVTNETYQTLITCEQVKYAIPGADPEEFPEVPVARAQNMVIISQYALREMINTTNFSIAPLEERGNALMSGQLFEVKDNYLRIVALDSYRISIRREFLAVPSENVSVVIPGKAFADVAKLLSGDLDKKVTISIDTNHVMFEFNDTRMVCRLIDGKYFAIDNIISMDYETKIILNRKNFMECIERSMLLVRDIDKKPVILNIKDNNMSISMRTSVGKMEENIDITKMGKEIMIGLNPKFVSDAIRAIDDENISIYFINPKAPCYIRDDNSSYNYVIQPVNFKVTED